MVSLSPATPDVPHLIGLDGEGRPVWTRRFSAGTHVQDVRAAPDGGVYIVGAGPAGGLVIRLGADGAERWRHEMADSTPVGIDADASGAVVVALEYALERHRVVAVRLGGSEDVVWDRVVFEGRDTWSFPSVAVLEEGVAVGYAVGLGREAFGGSAARVAFLHADGSPRRTAEVGPASGSTTYIADLVARPGGRLDVVLASGPERLGRYEGDDFDNRIGTLPTTG